MLYKLNVLTKLDHLPVVLKDMKEIQLIHPFVQVRATSFTSVIVTADTKQVKKRVNFLGLACSRELTLGILDIDECTTGLWATQKSNVSGNSCSSQAVCVNTQGSFLCCPHGFMRNERNTSTCIGMSPPAESKMGGMLFPR